MPEKLLNFINTGKELREICKKLLKNVKKKIIEKLMNLIKTEKGLRKIDKKIFKKKLLLKIFEI